MSEHFLCEEMIEAGVMALDQATEREMEKRLIVRNVFLVMREIEEMALMRGESERVH